MKLYELSEHEEFLIEGVPSLSDGEYIETVIYYKFDDEYDKFTLNLKPSTIIFTGYVNGNLHTTTLGQHIKSIETEADRLFYLKGKLIGRDPETDKRIISFSGFSREDHIFVPENIEVKSTTIIPNRLDNDNYFMSIAKVVSLRSTCPRANVGSVIVKDNRLISTGYNGSPSGHKHCIDEGCYLIDNHCKRSVHAEVNAICSCARLGIGLKGASIYVTHFPCIDCTHQIIQSGIKRVYYLENYSVNQHNKNLLEVSGIELFYMGD